MSTRSSRFQPSSVGVGQRPAVAADAGPSGLVVRARTAILLLAATGLCLSATLVASASASASLVGEVTEFSAGITVESLPSKITAGPEGDLWFTERNNNSKGSKVARMTPTGEVTEFPVREFSEPQGIALGPDGNLWFAEANNPEIHSRVGEINPATHAVADFSTGITEGSQPSEIVAGPDGNLWFTERTGPAFVGRIARINPTTHVVTEFSAGITGATDPAGIAAGPDGNVWFTEEQGNRIGRITPSGTITEFPIPTANSQPVAIVTGSDGNVWFAEQDSLKIGRITPTGTITEFPLPSPDNEPRAIAAGPDGNIWFAMDNGDIGRITPAGVITTCTTGIAGDIEGLTAGPDGSMWFTETFEGRIGKITATGTGLASSCTSGSTPIPAGPPSIASSNPTPKSAPALVPATATVRLDGSSLDVLRGVATAKLSCSGTATCVGKLMLIVKSKPKKGKRAKTETIGTASFSIPAGETKPIRIKLQGAGPALLKSAHGNLGAGLKIAKASPSPSKTETESVHLKQQKAVQKK
jgi:streptogramin lyase